MDIAAHARAQLISRFADTFSSTMMRTMYEPPRCTSTSKLVGQSVPVPLRRPRLVPSCVREVSNRGNVLQTGTRGPSSERCCKLGQRTGSQGRGSVAAMAMRPVHLATLIEKQRVDIENALSNNTYIVYNNAVDCSNNALRQALVIEECDVDVARDNDATRAQVYNLDNPFEEGTFRYVAKGVYTSGNRAGEECVCKWFKTGVVFEDWYFEKDLEVVDKAIEFIDEFNQAGIIDVHVRVNRPEIWRFRQGERRAGQRHLIEPFIPNFEKFNSNSGWNEPNTEIQRAMQALSHFSYHVSGGRFVLCDLQGGLVKNGAEVVLTDPVILSYNRSFGSMDLGKEGIGSFFSRHVCNEFCQGHWSKPRDVRSRVQNHRDVGEDLYLVGEYCATE
ncbi:hypothetical protein CYMTET_19457 [Cymbomonas tetramitiformis]|uniref:Alpha-type protein kinase domain-containing protein n=1 Tax=Cymbomonas tetramitiformis TaxID=36881 RepID=A0AAE0G648_9CHLO|nr:hypothetical protein CYMTET_19457 [Cymbomonas tetramitiformis]